MTKYAAQRKYDSANYIKPAIRFRKEFYTAITQHLNGAPLNTFVNQAVKSAMESDLLSLDSLEAHLLLDTLKQNWKHIKKTNEADAILNLMQKLNREVMK